MKVGQKRLKWIKKADGTWETRFRLAPPLHLRLLELWEELEVEDTEDCDEVKEFLESQDITILGEIISIRRMKARDPDGWFSLIANTF